MTRGPRSRTGGATQGLRLVLFTTRATRRPISITAFRTGDVLLFGRESAGVPEHVHAAADARLTIPMRAGIALAQRGDGRRDGGGRGDAADGRHSTG